MVDFIRQKIDRTTISDPVVTIDNLSKLAPKLRAEVAETVRLTLLQEDSVQRHQKNPISQVRVDGVQYKGRGGAKDFTRSIVQQVIKDVYARGQLFYQGDMDTLKDAVTAIWTAISAQTPKKSGEAWRTFYFVGYADGAFTNRKNVLGAILSWIDEQTDPLTSVRIEGPQTPYRRKLIYLYANKKYSSGSKAGEYRSEKLKARGLRSDAVNKLVFDERAEFRPKASLRLKLIPGRHRDRYETYAYKAYLKTIAQKYKRLYRGLWIGYRFVPSYEPLKSYPSSTGNRPWGKHLPQIYIGLNPARQNR